MPEKDKWVHLNRCKPYEKSRLTIPLLESTGKEAVELNTPEGYRGNQGAPTQKDLLPSSPNGKGKTRSYLQGDSYRESVDDLSLDTSTRGEGEKHTSESFRYPRRVRTATKFYGEVVPSGKVSHSSAAAEHPRQN